MKNKLWCDLKTNQEKIEFLKSGRAWETGIIAKAIIDDIIEAFEIIEAFNILILRCPNISEFKK